MSKKFMAGLGAFALAALAAGCGGGDNAYTTNSNAANTNAASTATANTNTATAGGAGVMSAPDNSEIRTETAGGVSTQTRTFRDSSGDVEKVVVTTRGGKRVARVYYRDRTVRELPESDVERALDAGAGYLAEAGRKGVDVTKTVASEVGDKTEDAAGKVKDAAVEVGDKAEDVKDQTAKGAKATAKGAKAVGSEVGDKAEDVGGAAASGAKKAGKKTAEGAKKAGGAIKDAVTP